MLRPSGLTRDKPLSEALAKGEETCSLFLRLVCAKISGDSGHAFLVYKTGSSLSLLSCKAILL